MISDEAVEAAAGAVDKADKTPLGYDEPSWAHAIARAALEAAAPFIAAQALGDNVLNAEYVDRLERELDHTQATTWDDALQYADDEGYLLEHQTKLLQNHNPYRSGT